MRSSVGRRRRRQALRACATAVRIAVGLAASAAGIAHADLIVAANSIVVLNAGTADLQCTDVLVAGVLRLGTGSIVNARNVTIQAGGVIEGQSGIITLGGNWTNSGQFVRGTSAVRFRDLCSLATASVSGNTSFATASFVSGIGKRYDFAVNSTQTVNTILEILGTAGQPIQFRSSTPGQVANIDLLPGGTQPIQHVGVTDAWATGQWLAPNLTNEGGGGNARRWFGEPTGAVQPIPALAGEWLSALVLMLGVLAGVALRRQRRFIKGGRGRPIL